MKRLSYPTAFAIVVLSLVIGAVFAFGRISARSLSAGARAAPSASPITSPGRIYAAVTAADVARFTVQDSAWRAEHAPQFTLAELRARGDGRRSAREEMQDRVYEYRRQGQRAKAIAELERWVASHPRDQAALLSLARLLNEAGRTDAAVRRYRQLIALQEGRRE